MNSATGASVLAQEMPTSKSFFLECNCKIYVRFHDKDLAINFGRGYAYAMRQRDFVYGVVLLALVNRLSWFLWACAIGSIVYACILGVLCLFTRPSASRS